jgi:hypothetical protein
VSQIKYRAHCDRCTIAVDIFEASFDGLHWGRFCPGCWYTLFMESRRKQVTVHIRQMELFAIP